MAKTKPSKHTDRRGASPSGETFAQASDQKPMEQTLEVPTLPSSPALDGGAHTPVESVTKQNRLRQLEELMLRQSTHIEALLATFTGARTEGLNAPTNVDLEQRGNAGELQMVEAQTVHTPQHAPAAMEQDAPETDSEEEWEDNLHDLLINLSLSGPEVESFLEAIPSMHLADNLPKELRLRMPKVPAAQVRRAAKVLLGKGGPFSARQVMFALVRAQIGAPADSPTSQGAPIPQTQALPPPPPDPAPQAPVAQTATAARPETPPPPQTGRAEVAEGQAAGPSRVRKLAIAPRPAEVVRQAAEDAMTQVSSEDDEALAHDFMFTEKSRSVRVSLPTPEVFHGDVKELIPAKYKNLESYVACLVKFAIRGDVPLVEVLDLYFKGAANAWLTMVTEKRNLAQMHITPEMIADPAYNKTLGIVFREHFIQHFGKQLRGKADKAFNVLMSGKYGQSSSEVVALYYARLLILLDEAKVPDNFQRVTYFVNGLNTQLRDRCRTDVFGQQFKKLSAAFDFALTQETALVQRAYEANTNVVPIQRQAALVASTPDASQTLLYAQEREKRKAANKERRKERKRNKAEAIAKGTYAPKAARADAKGQAFQRPQQQGQVRGVAATQAQPWHYPPYYPPPPYPGQPWYPGYPPFGAQQGGRSQGGNQGRGRGRGRDGQGRGGGRGRGGRGRGGGFYAIQTTDAEPPPLNLNYYAGAEDPAQAQDDNAMEE